MVMERFGCALGLVGVCLAGCDVTLNKLLFIFSVTIEGFCYSGHALSLLDMSPEYAGTLMGISNTVSSLTGFLTPMVVGALTDGNNTLHQWRIVFGITAIILLIETFVFIFFATADKQDWAEQVSSEEVSNVPKKQAQKRNKYTQQNKKYVSKQIDSM
ncbi:sialin [Trichonephila inaurata madagascariensis]|uniref:Sialin n=1 Tax=Trichonephila inaurata madagascariensis TaxID=2747483 RepID=A0A8X7C9Q9_9ARAC|nr:sialin [Trichonephila inaurata madagascariensis]